MKTILVDAFNTIIQENKILDTNIIEILKRFKNSKIVLTNANKEQSKNLGFEKIPYSIFTLAHNPEKTDSKYFEIFLKENRLLKDDVIYFEHNLESVKSAQSLGITSYHFDKELRDYNKLEQFISNNI